MSPLRRQKADRWCHIVNCSDVVLLFLAVFGCSDGNGTTLALCTAISQTLGTGCHWDGTSVCGPGSLEPSQAAQSSVGDVAVGPDCSILDCHTWSIGVTDYFHTFSCSTRLQRRHVDQLGHLRRHLRINWSVLFVRGKYMSCRYAGPNQALGWLQSLAMCDLCCLYCSTYLAKVPANFKSWVPDLWTKPTPVVS